MTCVGFLIGMTWGIEGVAASFSITMALSVLFMGIKALRIAEIPCLDVVRSLIPAISASSIASGGLYMLFWRYPIADVWLSLFVQGVAFGCIYFVVVAAQPYGRRQLTAARFLIRRRDMLGPI